jgi:hypothetical protein
MKRALFKLLFIVILVTPLSSYGADFHGAQVADISDRKYEPAVIELLDNAKESILISMYVISSATEPINLLLNDLVEALERGVKVEIYLNTCFESSDHFKLTKDFKALKQKGAEIYLASPHHRLHDKLIIVDGRFVVDGSTNWSVSALKANYESAVIIDSPEIAQEKMIRVRNILLAGMEGKKEDADRPDRPEVKAELPDTIEIPRALLEEKKYFSKMRAWGDNRGISAYLLLIAESARVNKTEFFLNLEDFANELRMPQVWTATAKRRQIIKTLKKLSNSYKLITVTFTHGKDAWIKHEQVSGDTFTAQSKIFNPDFLARTSPTAKTVLLIDALLKDEGHTREDFSEEELYERFHTTSKQFRKGMRELELMAD